MTDDEERQEESERPRPRIVDKRVSARRGEGAGEAPAPAPPPSSTSPPESGPPESGPPESGPPESGPPESGPPESGPPEQAPPAEAAPTGAGPAGEEGKVWTPEEEAQAQEMARELAERPSEEWVLNIAVTLANVAGAKIQLGVPEDARLAIDALEAIVTSVAGRIEGAETPLRQTLAQLQMVYAQTVQGGQPPAPPAQ